MHGFTPRIDLRAPRAELKFACGSLQAVPHVCAELTTPKGKLFVRPCRCVCALPAGFIEPCLPTSTTHLICLTWIERVHWPFPRGSTPMHILARGTLALLALTVPASAQMPPPPPRTAAGRPAALYDAAGWRTALDDAAGRLTALDDAAGRRTALDDAAGWRTALDDAAGRRTVLDGATGRRTVLDDGRRRRTALDDAAGWAGARHTSGFFASSRGATRQMTA